MRSGKNHHWIVASMIVVVALAGLSLSAQEAGKKKSGFRFRGGDPAEGGKAFAQLNCIQCHTVAGLEVPVPKGKRRFDLKLGEEVLFVKRYEDLVTAITAPRHVVNERYRAILTDAEAAGAIEPLMPDMTHDMSVHQLIDIVAFLDGAYAKAQEKSYGKPAE
jgi:hypothetical protein